MEQSVDSISGNDKTDDFLIKRKEIAMEKRTILLAGIPASGILAVANLLFFWLAPDVSCKILVYGFCSGVILIQGITTAVLWYYVGLPKALPVAVSGTSFALGIVISGGLMLALNAPFRMALYFLIVFSVLYLICVGFLSCIAADALWDSPENAITGESSGWNPVGEWLRTMRAAFSRHRPGESTAERHVRNNREVPSQPAVFPAHVPSPPPLPSRRT